MNEQKTGLSENKLERVAGGVTLPDTDENLRAWDDLIRDLQRVLKRYMAGEDAGLDRQRQRKLGEAYNLSGRCLHELNSYVELLRTAKDLNYALMELRELPDIEEQRLRLTALL